MHVPNSQERYGMHYKGVVSDSVMASMSIVGIISRLVEQGVEIGTSLRRGATQVAVLMATVPRSCVAMMDKKWARQWSMFKQKVHERMA